MIPNKLSGSLIWVTAKTSISTWSANSDQEDPNKQKRQELRESSRMQRTKTEIITVQM